MPVATVGSPQTIALGAADALIVSCSAVDAVASVAGSTGFVGAPYELGRVVGEQGRRFGPYGRAVSLIVSSLSGSITAEVSQPSRAPDAAGALSAGQAAATQALVSGAGSFAAPQAMYRVATFGDSRCNTNGTHMSTTSGASMAAEVVGTALCRVRPDCLLVFNGGIGGSLAVDWDTDTGGRQTANKGVDNVLAAAPDIVTVQFGINDIVSWNGSSPTQAALTANIVAALQGACAALMGGGPYVVFESINPASAGASAVSYINGYAAAAGFGASSPEKLQVLADVNAAMRSWFLGYAGHGIYVDTSSATTAADGYARTDGTYKDGAHLSALGSLAAARIIAAAIAADVPLRANCLLPGRARSAINGQLSGVSAGKAAGWGTSAVSGTWDADVWSVEGDDQVVTMRCTALASGSARRHVQITPTIIGAGTRPAYVAGDIWQARVQYEVDDGAGGAPACYAVIAWLRVFYNDTTNESVTDGSPATLTSTDHPAMPAHTEYLMTPRLAVKAAMSNATIITNTVLNISVSLSRTGTVRLRMRNAEWRKVA